MQHPQDVPQPDAALVRAMGGALSILATLLSRRGIVDMSEVATSETDETEGWILGCWAGMLRDVAEHQNVPSDNDHPT